MSYNLKKAVKCKIRIMSAATLKYISMVKVFSFCQNENSCCVRVIQLYVINIFKCFIFLFTK